ncbi:protein containing transposase DDE domain [Thioalkalivibrio nitratireducens DSM 14787]|uniref:Protein containing transposase DDE domain n=2 Tax=Thioalkalivibrio nitratireducens TaxID=186931 RepID=L0DTQ1_THIND|nr:protein containing transposase DDE domain [Thioalkalivibrio nitratireducens DSM 14787]
MVLDNIRSTLNDPEFVAGHRYQPTDFSRQRTLTFERVALSLLSGPIVSLRHGADALCQGLGLKGVPLGVTKQALSKAYRKFPYEALIELQQRVAGWFTEQVPGSRWMGYRLVAVDGTKIRLPLDPELAETFGTQGNQTATERPMALYVSHFDASNGIPLGGELSPSYMGERFLAERLLEERASTDLMLYDRGFPSFALFALHRHLDRAFCARLTLNFCTEVIEFLKSGAHDAIIEWRANAGPRRDCAQLGISAAPLRLRLVRVSLPGGTTEVLATSLLDAEAFPAHLFKDLYQQRWAVEESFKALKPALRVEQF